MRQDRDCWVASERTAAAPSTRLLPVRSVGPVLPDRMIFNKKRKSESPSFKLGGKYLGKGIYRLPCWSEKRVCVNLPSGHQFAISTSSIPSPNPSTIGPTSLRFPVWHPAISTEESYTPAHLLPSLFSNEIPLCPLPHLPVF